jgi:hypothetical protein
MEHKNILENIHEELSAGIVEITYTDSYSVEYTVSVTLSENHLDIGDSVREQKSNGVLTVWNVCDEKWQDIPVFSIIDAERLTGFGVKDERDLVDFDTHPLNFS